MKKRIPSFLMGVVATVMVLTLSLTALAATGAITIEVAPIDVLVDGKVFQPKDANGNDVMVFVHNGTTYAPLRALAEAYGLEVGYDGEKRVATVSQMSKTTYPETQNQTPTNTPVDYIEYNGGFYILGLSGDGDIAHSEIVYTLSAEGETLVFYNDISVNVQDPIGAQPSITFFSSWMLKPILAFALDMPFTKAKTPNPHLELAEFDYQAFDKYFSFGVEETQYISATEAYKPQWLEYNGARIYNAKPYDHKNPSIVETNGVRHYRGYICLNDVFRVFGINKSLSIGTHENATTLVIK